MEDTKPSEVEAAAGAARPRLYRVAWRSKITGHASHGAGFASKAAVEKAAELMNDLFPELVHWCEPAAGTAVTTAAANKEG